MCLLLIFDLLLLAACLSGTKGAPPILLQAVRPATSSAPADDVENNHLVSTPNDVHTLILDDTLEAFAQGEIARCQLLRSLPGVVARFREQREATPAAPVVVSHTSRVITLPFEVNEVVPSWNVKVPDGGGFVVEIRFGRLRGDMWTPFYYLGGWGAVPAIAPKVIKDDNGLVDIDHFRSSNVFDRVQYRIRLSAQGPGQSPILRRFALACSNTRNDAELARRCRKIPEQPPKEKWCRRLPVPFRNQKLRDARGRGGLCSPTSTAMVMEYCGVNLPTLRVADLIWDDEHEIYGNWARAVQAAYVSGVPGYIQRFGDWPTVQQQISEGRAVVASIRAPKGTLRGAPYSETTGHLLVVTGFDDHGGVCINDPAAVEATHGVTTYAREDMEKAWFQCGGVGYVFLPLATPH